MRAPSLVARLYTSRALPLLRFSRTYEAVVSMDAAAAGEAGTSARTTPTTAAASAAMRAVVRRSGRLVGEDVIVCSLSLRKVFGGARHWAVPQRVARRRRLGGESM